MEAEEIDRWVSTMDAARAVKDYLAADSIRAGLLSVRTTGPIIYRLALSTGPKGTKWHWTANTREINGK